MSIPRSYFIVPAKIDLKLLENGLPVGSKLTKDKMAHLLTIILDVGAHRISSYIENEYVLLSSTLLQSCVREYKAAAMYLEQKGVIEIKPSYSAMPGSINGYSKGYRVAVNYVGDVKRGTYSPSYSQTVAKQNRKRRKERIQYTHLDKWINSPDFCFDENKAKKINQNLLQKELHQINQNKLHNNVHIKVKFKADTKYMLRSMAIESIKTKKFEVGRDKNTYRYHSPITNLKKELRKCYKYQNKAIYQIDITNSQPYLLQILLSSKQIGKLRGIKEFSQYEEVVNRIETEVTNTIMLVKDPQVSFNQAFTRYVKMVNDGLFYEDFMVQAKAKLNKTISRDEAKIAVLQALYSGNQFIGYKSYNDADSSLKTMFKECYPGVYQIIKTAKTKDRSVLARLLQRIESYLIIDKCCETLRKEHPTVPIWTIHDSIATVEEHLPLVKHIMEDEFVKLLGAVPTLKEEKW